MELIKDYEYKCECYYGHSDRKGLLKIITTDGSSAVLLYRLGQLFIKMKLSFFGSILTAINKLVNGCVIGRYATFGAGFVLMHPVGVVINGGVKGGQKIVIESGVVIGAARNGFPVEVPVLGNNVFIGSGAKILGGITIGNDAIIGANAVVLNNVPNGVTVVGIPAKIVARKDS